MCGLATKYSLSAFRRIAAPRGGSIVKGLDIRLPLLLVHSRHASIVGDQTIDLALDIGGLGPHTSTTRKQPDLFLQLAEQKVATIVPRLDGCIDLIGLVDSVDGGLAVPEAVAES